MDNVVFNICYGYKTMFAYYHENQIHKIPDDVLQQNIFIQIKCGTFSYAQIPEKFNYIMGVTGTLESLSNTEKKIISEDYKIQLETIMPSVFGKNMRKFNPKDDIYIENKDDYFNRIMNEAHKKLEDERAVLIFFDTMKDLNDFYNSP